MGNMGNIFVVTHKKFEMELPEQYIPIQVGRQFTNVDLGHITDETNINIAKKNPNYCELTAFYWVWKNYELNQYIGFSHYRRYLESPKRKNKIINVQEINELLEKYDVIVPKKFFFKYCVGENYFKGGVGKEEDLPKLRNVIEQLYPEYLDSYDKVLNGFGAHYCNMFIMKIENFNKYMKWLFNILENLEAKIDLKNYNKAEARIYGYISEFLLDVWCDKNMLKLYECSMIQTEISKKDNLKMNLKMQFYKVVSKLKKYKK